jgi:hypothetical protein
MKFSLAILACIATSVVAGPLKFSRSTFSDPTCKLSKAVTPGTPLGFLFPVANLLGTIVGPTVKGLIGAENEEALDKLADNLCMSVENPFATSHSACLYIHVLTCVGLPQQLPTRTSRRTWHLCRAPASRPRFRCRENAGWSSPLIQLPVEPSLRVSHSSHTPCEYIRSDVYKNPWIQS